MDPLKEQWDYLTTLLPPDWKELARETGAIRRARGITEPSTLLQLLLMHAGGGLSLRQTVARAREQGIADVSDVALLKRLRTSGAWLEALTRGMFRESRFGRRAAKVSVGRTIRVVDATSVQEPGATGSSWRVHYSLRLPDLVCDHYQLTDDTGGETMRRFPVRRGDVILGDRGYSNRAGAAHVIDRGADVVVRLNHSSFPLLHPTGGVFDVARELKSLRGQKPGVWLVAFEHGGRQYSARLCAVRKTKVASAQARRKLLKEAGGARDRLQPETLAMTRYIAVLSTLPWPEFTTADVLELYRARWQVELAFKRMKSLMQVGHVPKKNDESARAWIEAKLLTVLLVERLLEDARAISPWGFVFAPAQPLA